MPILNQAMTLCISLAGRPSNIGTRFHNHLYDELGLNFVYKGFTTDDLEGAVRGVRALGIRGCSVSMPYKEAILPFLDELEPSAVAIDSVNTVVNEGGILLGSNTDVEAVAALIRSRGLDRAVPVVVRGSGGMAKAVVAAFHESGFENLTVVARNAGAGLALAERYGAAPTPHEPEPADVILVNATPLGMAGPHADTSAFSPAQVRAARAVLDVVALPSETPLIRAAREVGTPVTTGAEVIALQAARQFERYTGVVPTPEQVARASEFSRAE